MKVTINRSINLNNVSEYGGNYNEVIAPFYFSSHFILYDIKYNFNHKTLPINLNCPNRQQPIRPLLGMAFTQKGGLSTLYHAGQFVKLLFPTNYTNCFLSFNLRDGHWAIGLRILTKLVLFTRPESLTLRGVGFI